MQEINEDWLLFDGVLGEGAYGEVRLLVHKTTHEKVACKIIDHEKYKNAASNINREIVIHRMLDHPNIIKFYGRRTELLREFIFLEYAHGGELFQMIEPDIGMPSKDAQTYFKQLLEGLKYIHSKGITHRDIKPENLLIDGNGVLKISDFGMSTIFRMKGKERSLQKRCGTKPYIAPEVLDTEERPYKAQPADIWSCGIVFVAMLAGELPWSEPTSQDRDFVSYKEGNYISLTPWSKLGNTALSLVRSILHMKPPDRFTIEQILRHPWMKFEFDDNGDELLQPKEVPMQVQSSDGSSDHIDPLAKRRYKNQYVVILAKTNLKSKNGHKVSVSQSTTSKRTSRNILHFIAGYTGKALELLQIKDHFTPAVSFPFSAESTNLHFLKPC